MVWEEQELCNIAGRGRNTEDIHVGDIVHCRTGEPEVITNIWLEKLPQQIRVYNFFVEDCHNYYVSEKGVLVHKFEPDFPKEFDTLLIEHADKKWYIPRNKLIDKFIRKSKKVYNKVGEERKFFILKFLKNGKEVYSIPYDDIGYPENAIKIMSDIILKEFQNGY